MMLQLENISKRLGSFSVGNISLHVKKGEYFIILGISGAGKSMLLELIAGLVSPDSGKILLEGKEITDQKIQQRGIGLVFQDFAVFPHLSVRENISYSLHGSGLSHAHKTERITGIAQKMNIAHLLDRRPSTLSGGELQRVALARTLVQNPKILLLDEPLSSLDSKLRGELRSLLREINRMGQTVIHVTHDYEEAVSLADTIAVVHEGTIIQTGSPEEVFAHPKSEFVAHFIGIKNFHKARIRRDPEGLSATIGSGLRVNLAPGDYSDEGFLLIGSDEIILSKTPVESSMTNVFQGTVTEVVPTRNGIEVTVDIGFPLYSLVTQQSVDKLGIREGSAVFASFKATAVRFINQ